MILGERRWQAAQIAGLATLACVVVDENYSEAELRSIQVIENALREDLQPIEQARAFESLMKVCGWTQAEVARELNITQSAVAKALATLNLPVEVQEMVDEGKLDQSKAYEVSRLSDPEEQAEVAARVVSEGLSRDQTVEVVRQVKAREPSQGKPAKGKPGNAASNPKGNPVAASRFDRPFKANNGYTLTLSRRKKGVDLFAIIEALEEAIAVARGELAPADEDAA